MGELMTMKQFGEYLGWDYQKARRLALKYGQGTFLTNLMGRNYVVAKLFDNWLATRATDEAMEINLMGA